MALNGFTEELSFPVSAERMFKATVLDAHNLGPKLMPEVVVSAEIVGDGGVGTIKHYTFTDALPFKFVKERVDLLDKEKLECKYTVIEGAGIGNKLESAAVHIKFENSGNGGSLCKIVAKNKPLSGVKYTEEDVNVNKNGITGMFKAFEAYLIANPDAYA